MKKFIVALAVLLMTAAFVSAQDLGTATDTYNKGAEALSIGDKSGALKYFKEALTQAEACGDNDEAVSLASDCKKNIPAVILAIGKEEYNAKKFDAALEKFQEALEVAKEYENADVVEEVEGLLPNTQIQCDMAAGKKAAAAKDFPTAIAAFKKILDADPENMNAALLLGQAYNGAKDNENAIATFSMILEKGSEKDAATAKKQLSTIYLKEGQALLKEKKFKEALAACEKSNEYIPSANACKLAASAASQSKDNATAIKYYEQYLELSPNAKDANAITFTMAALYQQAGNKAKAIENYKKVENDAQYGAEAKKQIENLSK